MFTNFVEYVSTYMDDNLKTKWLKHIKAELICPENMVFELCSKEWFERVEEDDQ